jgi:glycerophosphoryl diester phosphodiesterase
VVEIWAHRGARSEAPENTMPAFLRAFEVGADGVEFDVQLSSDGQPVVIHDETLERTTNGRGRVCDHTFAELRSLDASAGFDGFADARIPHLDEVLTAAAEAGCRVNVELKNSVIDYPGLEEIVLDALARTGTADRAVLSSFSEVSVARLVELTDIEVGLIFEVNELLRAPWKVAAGLGARALHPPRARATAHLLRKASEAGLAVRVWTVNGRRPLQRLARQGASGVFSDVPEQAREWLDPTAQH